MAVSTKFGSSSHPFVSTNHGMSVNLDVRAKYTVSFHLDLSSKGIHQDESTLCRMCIHQGVSSKRGMSICLDMRRKCYARLFGIEQKVSCLHPSGCEHKWRF